MQDALNIRRFVVTVLLTSIWVNASEIFRYFVIVMPSTREFLAVVPNVAPMNWKVFLVWGSWDTLLTALLVFQYWLVAQSFGNSLRSVILAGVTSWAFFFVLFWVGMCNMSLAEPKLALVALPLALLETVVASYIASRLLPRNVGVRHGDASA